jgi:CubicO group peptidase (beta-lactamase class C family)
MAFWTRASGAAYSLSAVAGALAACAGIAGAQHRGPAAPPMTASAAPVAAPVAVAGTHPLTAEDLETFLDGFMPLQIGRADIAGAVVSVVKDGHVLFEKGYGYADVGAKRRVSADSTLFRPGSISKLFTWTAVMQQAELGKLDLDRDINDYLDFKIPAPFGKPITIRDLMTHRPGFEETVKDLAVDTASQLRPAGEYLRTHMPAEIFAPGTVPAYSNYGATLAGYIVERVSGQSFDDYVEQHILGPLQMAHSTFRQPLPPALAPLMSRGYDLASGDSQPFELIEVAPAGSMSTAADDIAHFMIAQLGDGTYGTGRILQPATLAAMHARQPGWPDAMHAFALGFYEESQNGHRIIGHGGDTQAFHSDLHLILDADVGFFVSYSSIGRDDVSPRTTVFDAFMNRYFPAPGPPAPTLSTAAADARTVAGAYEASRRAETNILSALTMLSEVTLSFDPKDSTLLSVDEKGLDGQPVHYREVGPMRFAAVGGHDELAFTTDATGRRIAYTTFPFEIYQQVDHGLNRKTFNELLLGVCLGIITLTLLGWPAGAMIRKHFGRRLALDPDARRHRLIGRVVSLGIALFVVVLIALANKLNGLSGLGAAGDTELHALQILGVLCVVGALAVAYTARLSWRDRTRWVWARGWDVMLTVSCLGFTWFIIHWHLLNFNLQY